MIERMVENAARGGPILILLAALTFVAWYLVSRRYLALRRELRSASAGCDPSVLADHVGVASERADLRPTADARTVATRDDVGHARERLVERRRYLDGESRRLRGSLPIVAVLASAAPLLGLLGTVLGMARAFEALGLSGGDSRRLADGIGSALITTQAGLLVGLPLLIAHAVLEAKARRTLDAIARALHLRSEVAA